MTVLGYSFAPKSAPAPSSAVGTATAPNSAAGFSARGEVPGGGGPGSGAPSSQAGTLSVPKSVAGTATAGNSAAGAWKPGAPMGVKAPDWRWQEVVRLYPLGDRFIVVLMQAPGFTRPL